MYDILWLRVPVVAILVLSCGFVFAVMRLYYRAWKKLPRRAGLAPLHVFLVSLGVLLLQGALAWGLLDTLTTTASMGVVIRTLMYGAGSVVILVALHIIGGLQKRRLEFAPTLTTVTVSDSEVICCHDTVPPEDDHG